MKVNKVLLWIIKQLGKLIDRVKLQTILDSRPI
jgi:hypothetical protein